MSYLQTEGTGNGKQFFRILPENQPADNTYIYQGNPIISFSLPEATGLLLDPTTLRLNGKMRWRDGTAPNPASYSLDQFLGVNSCFQNLTWTSKHSRKVLERISHYPKLLNSILPAANSRSSYLAEQQVRGLSTKNVPYQRQAFSTTMGTADGIAFSTPIYSGLTMASGNRIPLGQLGGLILQLELHSNPAVITNTTPADSPEYELVELSLSGSYFMPDAEGREALAAQEVGMMELNVFSSLFSIVQASQHSSTFSLQMKDLIACYFSFVPASFINNYNYNEFQNMRLSNSGGTALPTNSEQLIKVNFLVSGLQKPFLFELDVVNGSNENQLQQYYLMALKKLTELRKQAIDSNDNDPRIQMGTQVGAGFPISTANQVGQFNDINYTLGIPYDLLSDQAGVNVAGKPVTITLQSNLDDATSNACYFFTLNKVDVEYTPQGITVMS